MEDKVYQIEGTAMAYEVGFEGDIVYSHLIRRVKECRIDQITRVVIKKTPMGSGEEISFRILFTDGGKEKRFPWIQAKIMHESTANFLDDLKERMPSHAIWEDRREGKADISVDGEKVFDLQFLPFGYGGSGLNRSVQLWIYTICLGITIIPLFFFVPILAGGGYRIYAGDAGLRLKKFGTTHFSWDDLKVNFQRVNVIDRRNYSQTEVMDVTFSGGGNTKKVVMRYDHVIPLMKELVERGVLEEDILEQFA